MSELDIVLEMGQINIRGNIIDHGWFQHLIKESGKSHLLAANILSEIVYWYKPVELKDPVSNQVTYKKKFNGDKLQKSYEQLADSFGVTKGQAKDACKFLEKKGLITIELRTIIVNGISLNNVMFIEPVPSAIKKISTLYQKNNTPVSKKQHRVYQKNDTGVPKKSHTYTEITTEILSSSSEHACEESGGVPSTVPSGDSAIAEEIPHTSIREDACLLIKNKYIALRGRGLDITPLDELEINLILDQGVAVEDALSWLEECFSAYKPRHPRDHIRAFSYITPQILDKQYAKTLKKSQQGASANSALPTRPNVAEGLNYD